MGESLTYTPIILDTSVPTEGREQLTSDDQATKKERKRKERKKG